MSYKYLCVYILIFDIKQCFTCSVTNSDLFVTFHCQLDAQLTVFRVPA